MCELNYCPHSQNFESEAFLLFAEKIGLALDSSRLRNVW